MRERRPWFKFWYEDFYESDEVRVMSAEGEALYLRLLVEQWKRGPLRDDAEFWRRVLGGSFASFYEAWDEVRPCFEECEGGIANRRLEEEREEADSSARTRKERAKKAASVRWACSKHATSMPDAMLGDAKKEKETKKKKKKKREEARAGALEGAAPSSTKKRSSKPRWDGETPPEWPAPLQAAWEAFQRHREEIRKPLTPVAGERLLARLRGLGEQRALAALEHTMANGWQGVREPDQPSRQNTPTGMDALKEVIEEDYEHGRRLNRGTRPRRVSRRSLPGVESNPGDVPGLPGGASRPSAGGGDGRLPLVGPGS